MSNSTAMITRKLTQFGYIVDKRCLKLSQVQAIKDELTIVPVEDSKYGYGVKKSFPVYIESGQFLVVPKCYGLQKFGPPQINQLQTSQFAKKGLVFLGELRENQVDIVNQVIQGMNEHGGGVLSAYCGFGKTICAIYIACHFDVKTLIVVTTEDLKNQMIKNVKKWTNVKSVGLIQGKKGINTKHRIVVAVLKSVSMIQYNNTIFSKFGLIIIDEVHHMGSPCYAKFFNKVSTWRMLGITAERERNDKTFKINHLFLGPFLHIVHEEPRPDVNVKVIQFYSQSKLMNTIKMYNGNENRSKMVTEMVNISSRNLVLVNLILSAYNQGRFILCLSDRINHLEILYGLLRKRIDDVSLYIGAMSTKELEQAKSCRVLLGTYSIASEGLDIPNLDTLIFATPRSSIRQPSGRILRKLEYGENKPLIIDLTDMSSTIFSRQQYKRQSYYDYRQFTMQRYRIADFAQKGSLHYKQSQAIFDILQDKPELRTIQFTKHDTMSNAALTNEPLLDSEDELTQLINNI